MSTFLSALGAVIAALILSLSPDPASERPITPGNPSTTATECADTVHRVSRTQDYTGTPAERRYLGMEDDPRVDTALRHTPQEAVALLCTTQP